MTDVETTDVAPDLTAAEIHMLEDGSQYGLSGLTFYLAARYTRREELLTYREDLNARGHRVPARWLHGDHQIHGAEANRKIEAEGQVPVDLALRFAEDDIEDIEQSDVLVCFTEEARTGPTRGGRHVEYGYALATRRITGGRRLLLCSVGPVENVFHAVDDTLRFETWPDFLTWFDALPDHCGKVRRFKDAVVGPCPLHPLHVYGPPGQHGCCCSPRNLREIV